MFKSIILLVLFLIVSSQLFAQTNLNGRYSYTPNKIGDSTNFTLTFERQDSVYYSYFYEGAGTIGGKWTLENGIIKIALTRGNENWILKFKQNGNDLEIAESLPEKGLADIPDFKTILSIGTVFKKEVSQPTGPDLTPEEIGERVLKLVKSIRTQKDIAPKNIKRQTGVKVIFDPKNRNSYGFGGNVTGALDWVYGFYAYPYPSKDNNTTDTLRFSFDYQLHEPMHPDTAFISKAFDFNSLSEELQKAGFSSPQPRFMNHNRLSGWTFTRGKVSLMVSVKGGFEPNIDKTVMGMIVSVSK